MFGFLYDRFGAPAAFGTGAALAGIAAILLALVPTRTPAPPHARTFARRPSAPDKIVSPNASNSRNQ
jgi:MFS family permease